MKHNFIFLIFILFSTITNSLLSLADNRTRPCTRSQALSQLAQPTPTKLQEAAAATPDCQVDICAICQYELTDVNEDTGPALTADEAHQILPNCSHECFHQMCLQQWRASKNKCPICKEPGQEITFQARRAKFKLFEAVKKDNCTAIPDLLAAGANIYSHNKTGEPLLCFAKTGAMVKLLHAAGANVHATDRQGNTPLHWAAKNNHTESAQSLLLAGSCIDTPNNNGDTPLHLAAHYDRIEAARLLLDAGANTTICNHNEQSPFGRAKTDEMRHLIRTYKPRHWIIQAFLDYLPYRRPWLH